MTYQSECKACGHWEKGFSRQAADDKITQHKLAGCDPADAWKRAEDRVVNIRYHLDQTITKSKMALESLTELTQNPDDLTQKNISYILEKAKHLLKNAERAEKDFYSNYPDPS